MPNVTKELADSVTSAGVSAAYGDPIELDGTTIVPVAMTSYGFGLGKSAGSQADDADSDADERSEGGGGGGMAWPIGAYVTRDGYTRFEPNLIALLAVGIPFVCVAGRALTRIIKALKK